MPRPDKRVFPCPKCGAVITELRIKQPRTRKVVLTLAGILAAVILFGLGAAYVMP